MIAEAAAMTPKKGPYTHTHTHTFPCKRFADYTKLTLCYKCLTYGQVATKCTGKDRCAKCAGPHAKTACPDKEKPGVRCGNCIDAKLKETKHAAGSKTCAIHQRKFKATIHYG
uniref:Uncharacterized protein n=1 Tax=Cacopsylla melanoneura TaxID=428564 RepID=A0A8D8WNN9_9HEMI